VQAKFSFSFDRLVATDGRGRVRTTFAKGQDVKIAAFYTIRNLKPGHILTGKIVRYFQIPVNGRFQQASKNSDPLGVAKSGSYKSIHDTSGFERAGTIRVVVQITFKKVTRGRYIDVHVR
jgi:hypothetical protein